MHSPRLSKITDDCPAAASTKLSGTVKASSVSVSFLFALVTKASGAFNNRTSPSDSGGQPTIVAIAYVMGASEASLW